MDVEQKLPVQYLNIDADSSGQRIDNYLLSRLKGLPKSAVYKLLRKGEVRVNKKRVKPEYKLQADDCVRVAPITLPNPDIAHSQVNTKLQQVANLESAIVFEDERLIAVNKPAGIAVHGGSGLQFGLIEAMRALRPKQDFMELVHRIDRETSGLLLIAKRRSALRHLHAQLRNKQCQKRYHALVAGNWSEHIRQINAPLLKIQHPSGERIVRVHDEGKPSVTKFRVLQSFAHASLIEASPITGRTHQIRVHCQHAGFAIVGDDKYCAKDINMAFAQQGFSRMFLHAAVLGFFHPATEQPMTLRAKYDKPLNFILQKLENEAN